MGAMRPRWRASPPRPWPRRSKRSSAAAGKKAAGAAGPVPRHPAPAQGQGDALRQHPLRPGGGGGCCALILLDSSLLEETEGLTGSEFSSPLLGRIFDLLRSRAAEGLSTQLPALAGALEPEEMAHLAWVAEQPENLANSRRALADYIALIREEGLRRSGTDEEALLRAAQKRYQETKAYMEEKP